MPLIKLNATQGLTGTLPAVSGANLTNIDGGKVLQVVSATDTTERSTTSNSFVDIVSASITPSSTSNKILIICGIAGIRRDNSLGYISARVTDGASFTKKFGHAIMYDAGTSYIRLGTANASFLHDANTTSAKTYTVQFNNNRDSGNAIVGDNGDCNSTITLMEIAGW